MQSVNEKIPPTEIDKPVDVDAEDLAIRKLAQSSPVTIETIIGQKVEVDYGPIIKSKTFESVETDDSGLVKRQNAPKSINDTFNEDNELNDELSGQNVHVYQIHGRVRQFVSKLNKTRRVCDIMTRILKGDEIKEEDLDLENFELALLTSLLHRKYNNATVEENSVIDPKFANFTDLIEDRKLRYNIDFLSIEDKPSRVATLKKFVDFIQNLKLIKRIEENNKFVYKHTTSYLLTQFVFQNNLKFNANTENLYYQHYFTDHAKTMNLNVSDFCDPLKTNVKGTRKAKSLNTDYLLRILTCDKYREEFFRYLQSGFEDHYLSATYKKLERMLATLEDRLTSSSVDEHDSILKDFIKTKVNHRWCKIPWNKSEVGSAVEHFYGYFSDLLARRPVNMIKVGVSKLKGVKQYNHKEVTNQPMKSGICELKKEKEKRLDIEAVGTIMSYKKAKKYSLSLFEPSDFLF